MDIASLYKKYGNDGYPQKEHEKNNSPVKKLSDLDDNWRSYGQIKDFEFFYYVSLLYKTKNGLPCENNEDKIPIFGFSGLW